MTIRTAVGGASATLDSTGMTFIAVFTATVGSQTVSDSQSNTWTALTSYFTSTGMHGRWSYVANPTTNATHTFSQPQSFSSIFVIATDEVDVSGSPLDTSNGANDNSNVTSLATGSITTTNSNCLLLSGVSHSADSNSPTSGYSIDSSFTLAQSRTAIVGVRIGGAFGYRSVTSTLTVNPTISWTAANPTAGSTVAFKGASSGGVTGTVAYTNANDTSSADGSTTIVGTVSVTNLDDTSTASGSTTITGTLSYTNLDDTSSASGSTTIIGTISVTNADDTATASGTIGGAISGTLAYTNLNDTSNASGSTTIIGTLSVTNNNDIPSAFGFIAVTGTSNTTNNNDICTASGTSGTSNAVRFTLSFSSRTSSFNMSSKKVTIASSKTPTIKLKLRNY